MVSIKELAHTGDTGKEPYLIGLIDGVLQFYPGSITVISSCSGMGRTSFMFHLMVNLMTCNEGGHIFVSNDENERRLLYKLLKTVSGLEYSEIKSQFEEIVKDRAEIIRDDCYFITHIIKWEHMEEEIVTVCNKKNIKFLYIDNIHSFVSNFEFPDRESEMNYIMNRLKKIAIEFQSTIIISSSVHSKINKRKDKRPRLSDLRDGNVLIDYADNVLLLYRQLYYGIYEDYGFETMNILEVIISKCRNCNPQTIHYTTDGTVACWPSHINAYTTNLDERLKNYINQASTK
ncbi:MAG TPA: DnaB-like helicase C-terminal domain-containing protein [Williamwhitmania sp.]|nr:DnaB-like helicase C-terminal domain-containing protein [Williamwhitmania sp.]